MVTTKFRKLAVSPGEYYITRNGVREKIRLTKTRLMSWVKNTKRLMDNGRKIPVPFAHADDKGNQPTPIIMDENGAFLDANTNQPIGWRSDLNAGFLSNIEYGTIDGREGIITDLDISGTEDNYDSPAGKFGRTIQETSLGIRPDYSDSTGESYGETAIHVAAVINPVELGQSNFALAMSETGILMAKALPKKPALPEELDESPVIEDEALSSAVPQEVPVEEEEEVDPNAPDEQEASSKPIPLRDEVEEVDDAPDMTDLIANLQEFGLSLPEDTTPENIVERLRLLVRQKNFDTSGEGTNDISPSAPSGSQTPSQPIAMNESSAALTILLSQVAVSKRESLGQRAQALVRSGRLNQEWVDKNLTPRIESLEMSENSLTAKELDKYKSTGQFSKSEVEIMIEGFESSVPDLTVNMSETGVSMDRPINGVAPSNPMDDGDSTHSWYSTAQTTPEQADIDSNLGSVIASLR